MKKATGFYSLLVLVSFLLLSLSSIADGVMSYVLYYAAFVLPLVLGERRARADKYRREEERGCAIAYRSYFEINGEGVRLFLPTVVPSVVLIMLLAALTSLVMSAVGISSSAVPNMPLGKAMVTLVLAPAVLEELLFRYLPLLLLRPYSPRGALIVSAILFGFFHTDAYQIPYAIIAGAVFMAVDLMTDSVIPSIVIHVVNNAVSVLSMYFEGQARVLTPIYAALGVLLLLSIMAITVRRGKYKNALSGALVKGEEYAIDPSVLALPLVSIICIVAPLITTI